MPSVLIWGGSGSLGSVVVKSFKDIGWTTYSVDFRGSDIADQSLVIKGSGKDDISGVLTALGSAMFDTIITVAGGFAMGKVGDDNMWATVEKMLSMNLWSALATAHVAAKTLKEGGLLVLTGAMAALNPTPTLLAYGIAKAACHHLIKSLSIEESGLPKGTTVVALLPIMLDTPPNREAMPGADTRTWTPLEVISEKLAQWGSGKERPPTGSFLEVKTDQNRHTFFTPLSV